MFGRAWRIGRIAGIDLRVDASWLIIAFLIAFSFYARFDALHAELSVPSTAVLAVVSAVAFFASVLLHELAHALMSLRRGIAVESITLFLFGGATAAKVDSKGPKEEFLISIVGPLTSVAIGLGLGALATAIGPMDDPVPGAIGYLAWINLALAVFNLLPGLPLDGGRVFRSAAWAITGSLHRATRLAATSGRILGYGLMALGVWSLFAGRGGGLWLAFIGWFLAQAAHASYVELELRRATEGVEAADVMKGDLVCIDADTNLADAAEEYFLRQRHSAFPVVDRGEVVGLLSIGGLRTVAADERRDRLVRDVMRPIADVPTVRRHDRLSRALEQLQDDDVARILVRDDDGSVVGIITPRDVSRWLQRKAQLSGDEIDLRGLPLQQEPDSGVDRTRSYTDR